MNAWRPSKCSAAILSEMLEGAESAEGADPWVHHVLGEQPGGGGLVFRAFHVLFSGGKID